MLRVEWVGDEDEENDEPSFVDASLRRLRETGRVDPPDVLELFEPFEDEHLLVLTSVDPFRPGIRYEAHLVLYREAETTRLDVVRVERV